MDRPERFSWDFPEREVQEGDRLLIGSPELGSASIPAESYPVAMLERVPEGDLPQANDRILVQREGQPFLKRAVSGLTAALPLAESSTVGLMTQAQASKLALLSTALQLPPGGVAGQLLAKTGDDPGQASWTDPPQGGGGGGGSLTFVNLGDGAQIYEGRVGDQVRFRSIVGGTAVTAAVDGSGRVTVSVANATTSVAGLMSAADKAKLNGIQEGVQTPPVFTGSAAPGLVPAPSTQPPSSQRFLAEDGVWRVGGGGGTISFGEPPESTAGSPSGYARAFIDGVGTWLPAPPVDHTHSLGQIQGLEIEGAPSGALVVTDGSTIGWRGPLSTLDLSDVSGDTPSDGDVRVWSESTQRWVPTSLAAPTSAVQVDTPLVGPTLVPLTSSMLGKIVPVDLSAGDVELEVSRGIPHAAGTVLYTQLRIGPTVLSGARLRIRAPTTATEPTIVASYLGGRGTNVATTAISSWAPEGSDKHTLNVPAGEDMALAIGVCAHWADLAGSPPTVTCTLDGASFTWTGNASTTPSHPTGDYRWYVAALGDLASPTTRILRLTGGTNVSCYSVVMVALSGVDQTSPLRGGGSTRYPTSVAAVVYSGTAVVAGSRIVYMMDRANASGANAPTTAGATQVGWVNVNTGSNRGAATVVLATELASGSGEQSCTVTCSTALNSTGLFLEIGAGGAPGMNVRTTGNQLADYGVPGDLLTLTYDDNNSEVWVYT